MKLATIAALLLLASAAHAQVFKVDAGQSTLYDTTGASVTTYLPGQTLFASAGVQQGKWREAFSDQFEFHGWDVTAGDSLFSFTAGSAGLGIAERGVAIGRKDKKQTLEFFVGAVGSYFAVPYYAGFGAHSAGAGVYWQRAALKGLNIATIGAIAGRQRTGLASITWQAGPWQAQATGGILQNGRYLDAAIQWHPTARIALTAAHNDFVYDGQRVTADNLGGSAGLGAFDFAGNVFVGENGLSETATAGLRLGPVAIHETWAQSPRQSRLLLTTVQETFHHLYFTQTYNGNNFSAGGGYHNNRFSISIDHSVMYYLLTGTLENSTTVSLSFRVPHSDATAALTGYIDPSNHLRYTASAETYAGHLLAGDTQGQPQHHSSGKYTVALHVIDDQEKAVLGAVFYVGKGMCITDTEGNCYVRQNKSNAVPLQAATDQFTMPGTWVVVRAPATATPTIDAAPIQVTVRRL